jgi:hypothetical protein
VIQFREALPEDDDKLTRLVGKPMPGELSLSRTCEPSLLEACARQGPPRQILTAVDEESILAVCTYFPWDYWVGGETRRVWTVSDFRAERRAANKSVTGLGWQALRERLDGVPALMSLVDDNPVSHRLFSKGRKGWPRLRRVARMKTLILPLALLPTTRQEAGLIRPKAEVILRALNRQTRHLTPHISADDLGRVTPAPENFIACHDGCSVVSCGALWDASDYRQIKISGYSGIYATIRSFCRRIGWNLLPEPGSSVQVRFACFLRGTCKESRSRVFQGLVERARLQGAQFLIWGQDAEDEAPFPGYWPRFTMGSTLYQLKWSDELDLGFARSGYEVAWL